MRSVRHSLRVPLCSEDRCGEMGDGLYRSIGGLLNDLQILADIINTLMVIAVDKHVGAKKCMEKITGQIISRVKYIFSRVFVQPQIENFPNSAVKIEIDELHALTNTKYRLILFHK